MRKDLVKNWEALTWEEIQELEEMESAVREILATVPTTPEELWSGKMEFFTTKKGNGFWELEFLKFSENELGILHEDFQTRIFSEKSFGFLRFFLQDSPRFEDADWEEGW